MPWKSGGGFTEEIATHPEGATLDNFAWRVSVAEVVRDGPFSRFAGVDRTIALIEGAGMRLSGGARDVVIRTPFEPYSFEGESSIDCSLVSGPIRDFNAMTRRDRARGSVTAVRAKASFGATDFLVVFAASGKHECHVDGEPPIAVAARHSLIVEWVQGKHDSLVGIRPLDAGSVALAVRIECH